MKLFAIMWSSGLALLTDAAAGNGVTLAAYSIKQMKTDPDALPRALADLAGADLALLHRTEDPFWEDIDSHVIKLRARPPIVVTGSDPSYWVRSSVDPEIPATVYRYLLANGSSNTVNLVRYLKDRFSGTRVPHDGPADIEWQGIHHPAIEGIFTSTEAYLDAYVRHRSGPARSLVGILYPRTNWITGNIEVERMLVDAFEARGIGVIPAFYYTLKDESIGNLSGAETVERFFCRDGAPLVGAIVRLTSFYLGKSRGSGGADTAESAAGVELLKNLNIPIFNPILSYHKNREEWLADPQGLGAQVAWSVAMPEFEGAIEPVMIGATGNLRSPAEERYEAVPDRVEKVAARVANRIKLAAVPNAEKRIAIILHNHPCGSVEATVGVGAHLDTLDSVADILARLKAEGYSVEVPENGKALIDDIMGRKAISEFRWTTVDEIIAKGGALARVDAARYREWFEELPEPTRARMIEAWGEPPGEEKDGIPAAMLHEGKIVVTGVRYGNAVVCVQPKRGCAGARCDGQVCKILHDPDVPPPHQYVATYRWISRVFGAHAIVHVGTHGNLEFLPGKGTGLSNRCLPDIGIDALPHLYIYNADNPPEGTIAKRRSYATLVDHMQTVMVQGELYGDLDALERLLEEYERYAQTEPGKAHTIGHLIIDKAKGLNILDGAPLDHESFPSRIREFHEKLSLMKNTQIPSGMHRFGHIPSGEKLADFVYAIVRYRDEPDSIRGAFARLAGVDLREDGTGYESVETMARIACLEYMLHGTPIQESMRALTGRSDVDEDIAIDVQHEIDAVVKGALDSDEMGALMNGLAGGFTPPGPSGIITRGRPDILPTGRNFYSLDPERVPTPAAWEIGKILAEKTIDKFLADEGRYPENIAFYWMCNDIMWADGEGLAQMLCLMGVRPVWKPNGRCQGFAIIPIEELGRPRIDITVRVSGISRDNFSSRIELLDEAVQAVAALDEPEDANYVRRHVMQRLAESGGSIASPDDVRAASYRVFASMPGTYQAGTQLAVFASAWKTEQDLADVFLYWNGYAYGKGTYGKSEHESLRNNLKTVDASFNKAVTDEYDLSGCCAYFGTHGGMINAARQESGKDIQNYYGDTREPGRVTVRTLTEEIRRISRAKILNPKWIDAQKEHGYRGASEISKRVGRIYGWEATAQAVDDSVFDDFARTFVMNEENRKFFEENNPWALEEIGRRLLEASERGLWNADPEVLDSLKNAYVQIEGWIEERMGDVSGEFQGGSVDIMTAGDVASWGKRMHGVLKK